MHEPVFKLNKNLKITSNFKQQQQQQSKEATYTQLKGSSNTREYPSETKEAGCFLVVQT